MSDDAVTEPELLKTITREQAATLVRSPGSTMMPPHDAQLGKKALEVLRTLTHDARALVDEAPLGQGGMGVIRLAKQVALDRRVAVKTLKPGLGATHDVEALLAEAWMAGGLEHPNILPVYSLSLDTEGKPVLVMKRIEGVTWATLISDAEAMKRHAPDRAPLEEHLRILQSVCNAVHFAHSRAVIHRDLKPENVMVGAFGEVYVVDWGIACPPGPTRQLAGTPAYMAPEMLGGAGASLSARTDVYLLGSMLFEVLTGKPPHSATTPNELFQVVMRSKPAVPADAPEELAELVRRCMSVSPDDRPESALEVRKSIEAFLEHQGSTRLTMNSELRAIELKAMVAQPGGDRTRIDSLFSACRFGLQQALVSWPGNTRARRTLNEVLELMARWELRHGSPRAAQVLVAEMTAPPADLSADLAAALVRETEKDAQLERLKNLEDALDPRTGGSSRTALAVIIGTIWVVLPVVGHFFRDTTGRDEMLRTAPVAFLSAVVLIVASTFARRNPRAFTPLNRSLLRMLVFAMLAQAIGVVVTMYAGFDPGVYGLAILAGYWGFITALLAVGLFPGSWPGIWPTVFAYTLGCALAALFPEYRYLITVGPSFVMVVNASWIARDTMQSK